MSLVNTSELPLNICTENWQAGKSNDKSNRLNGPSVTKTIPDMRLYYAACENFSLVKNLESHVKRIGARRIRSASLNMRLKIAR